MNVVSLFSGIGGFELAFARHNHTTTMMCEIDPVARAVLQHHFPHTPVVENVCDIEQLPAQTDLLCAGFPCQDLSSIGIKKGLNGKRSSLVKEVFRILKANPVEWVLIENVPYMLKLKGGQAIRRITSELSAMGYSWAYRTIDSASFVPQKRCRVFVLASLHHDPKDVILSDDEPMVTFEQMSDRLRAPIGFYWTEGRFALGLMENGIPTLKAGSTIGIPSAPAILMPNGSIGTPDIRDAERLQGFPEDWTRCSERVARSSFRWRLVGNAVTVDTVAWIVNKIENPRPYDHSNDGDKVVLRHWPQAAWGTKGVRITANVTSHPCDRTRTDLRRFLNHRVKPLSLKAIQGFWNRLQAGTARSPEFFRHAVNNYLVQKEAENANR